MQPDSFMERGVQFLQHYFDLAADKYADDIEPAFAPLANALVTFAGVGSADHVLDLGTGTGLVARLTATRAGDVTAVDFAWQMLKRAKVLGLRQGIQADLHRLPFKHGEFGLALASFAFNSTDPSISFAEVCRVIRAGGWLVFQEWAEPDPLSEIVSDTLASYMVDDAPPALEALRAGTEVHVPWDDLESVEDMAACVMKSGFEVQQVEVAENTVYLPDLDTFLRYKLAWPSRVAEIAAMPDETRRLLMSDLKENLQPHAEPDGSWAWRPQVVRIRARKPRTLGVPSPGACPGQSV